jgi:hypothetical protein
MRAGYLMLLLLGTPTVPPSPSPRPAPAPDASDTQRGVVNISTQAFGGFKMFDAGISAPNVLQATTAAMSLFVDGTLGNDSNACTSTGAGACLTFNGALAKAPKLLRHLVTITGAAGASYPGMLVTGFNCDLSQGATQVGLLVQGTLVASTLATGSTNGTATGGTTGTGQVLSTLTDSGATWTTNDLTGRMLCTSNSSPAGLCFPIESNTSTVISLVQIPGISGWVAPVGGVTTYSIVDSATVITGAANMPGTGSPFITQQLTRGGIVAMDNGCTGRDGTITFQSIMVANTVGGRGVLLGGNGSYMLNQMQVRPTVSTSNALTGQQAFVGLGLGAPQLTIFNSDFLVPGSGTGISWTANGFLDMWGSQVRANSTTAGQFGIISSAPLDMQGFEITGFPNGLWVQGAATGTALIAAGRINCSTYTNSLGVDVGWSTTLTSNNPNGFGPIVGMNPIDHINFTVCGIGIQVDGLCSAEIHGMSGSFGTHALNAKNGAHLGLNEVNLGGLSIGDGGTAAQCFVSIDNALLCSTSNADFAANFCLANSGTGSSACGR